MRETEIKETSSVVYENVNPATGSLTVNDGTYENIVVKAENSGETNSGDISLTDGTFSGVTTEGEGDANVGQNGIVTITGGTYENTSGAGYASIEDMLDEGCKLDGNTIAPADNSVAAIGSKGYTTLDDALTAANSGTNKTVTLLKGAELSSAIPSGVTLQVPGEPAGITLTVNRADLGTLVGSAGTIRVEAGGAIMVDGTAMIGGSSANIDLTGGYIDLKVTGSAPNYALDFSFVGATAEVPANHRWALLLNNNYPMNVMLDNATILTVNATGTPNTEQDDGLRVANNATLTNNGQIVVNGVMTVSSSGTVAGSGTITVNNSGVLEINKDSSDIGKVANNVSNSGTVVYNGTTNSNNLTGTITMVSGGVVYSQADISSKLSGAETMSNKTYDGTDYAFAWQYDAPSNGSSGGSSGYAITAEKATNGSVSVSPSRASAGSTVTVTVKPDNGYELGALTVTDNDGDRITLTDKGNGKYTFTMPRGAVTVKATFVEETADTGYSDVSASAWYADAVAYVTDNGMMQGNAGRFMPNDNLDRAMMAQILYNLEDNPAVNGGSAFGDVGSGAWYANAVIWASANSVITGYDNGNYGPNDSITREQMALMLYRYAALKGYETTQSGAGLTGFADAESVSSWASEAMTWAVNAGVINGKDGNRLDPQGTATRAEVAQVLMNFGQNVMP